MVKSVSSFPCVTGIYKKSKKKSETIGDGFSVPVTHENISGPLSSSIYSVHMNMIEEVSFESKPLLDGHDALDKLNDFQESLLKGKPFQINGLVEVNKNLKASEKTASPILSAILKQIRTRVVVELAKYGT